MIAIPPPFGKNPNTFDPGAGRSMSPGVDLALHRSAVATEIRLLLTPRQRETLGLREELLVLFDTAVTICSLLQTRAGRQQLLADLDDVDLLSAGAELGWTPSVAAALRGEMEAQKLDLPVWFGTWSTGGRRFLLQFAGSGSFNAIHAAFQSDLAVVVVAARLGLSTIVPYLGAYHRCLAVVKDSGKDTPAELLEALTSMDDAAAEVSLTDLLMTADGALARFAEEKDIPVRSVMEAKGIDLRIRQSDRDLALLLLDEISMELQSDLAGMNQIFAKKLRGAHDALDSSSDPISQAANSTIEALDRMLREAFRSEDYLDWIAKNTPTQFDKFTYMKDSRRLPTKYAQLLCFVCAGGPLPEEELVASLCELAATALTVLRSELQRAKHADRGGEPDEIEALRYALQSVESTLYLIVRVGWRTADSGAISQLRSRLAA